MSFKIWLLGAIVIFAIGVSKLIKGIILIKPEVTPIIGKIGYLVFVFSLLITFFLWKEQIYLIIGLYVFSAILIWFGKSKDQKKN